MFIKLSAINLITRVTAGRALLYYVHVLGEFSRNFSQIKNKILITSL